MQGCPWPLAGDPGLCLTTGTCAWTLSQGTPQPESAQIEVPALPQISKCIERSLYLDFWGVRAFPEGPKPCRALCPP